MLTYDFLYNLGFLPVAENEFWIRKLIYLCNLEKHKVLACEPSFIRMFPKVIFKITDIRENPNYEWIAGVDRDMKICSTTIELILYPKLLTNPNNVLDWHTLLSHIHSRMYPQITRDFIQELASTRNKSNCLCFTCRNEVSLRVTIPDFSVIPIPILEQYIPKFAMMYEYFLMNKELFSKKANELYAPLDNLDLKNVESWENIGRNPHLDEKFVETYFGKFPSLPKLKYSLAFLVRHLNKINEPWLYANSAQDAGVLLRSARGLSYWIDSARQFLAIVKQYSNIQLESVNNVSWEVAKDHIKNLSLKALSRIPDLPPDFPDVNIELFSKYNIDPMARKDVDPHIVITRNDISDEEKKKAWAMIL